MPAEPRAATPVERDAIDAKYQWDLSRMYPSQEAWEAHYREIEALVRQFAQRREATSRDARELLATLKLRDQINIQLEKLGAYATMRHDEDLRRPEAIARSQRAESLGVQYAEASSWFQPELLRIPEPTLQQWLRQDDLKVYHHYFDDLLRSRKHILSPREEELLAMSGKATQVAGDAFRLLSNTELRWRTVKDPDGRDVEITSGTYVGAIYSKDRRYRRDAFLALCDSFLDVKNTLATTLAGTVQRDWYHAKARGYGSSLEASLDAENLPVSVYHNLLRTIDQHLGLLHRYAALKQKALGLDQLRFYDLYVNLVDVPERKYTYEEARDLVLGGVEPFGPDYVGVLRRAFESRWIDVFENKGKRSGAYNMGTYLAPPYVLLNFQGTFNDVSTLAHELGHAAQSWYSAQSQPPVYAGYPMFTAEVASTAAEIVFKRVMLNRTQDPRERAFLINQMLEDMRGAVFRQTQFSEFDLFIHTLAEKGEPLTAEVVMKKNREIYERHYGPALVIDPQLDVECLRIPHYYRNFYVYRYATSYCAAAAIAQRILRQDPGAVDDWIRFLRLGNSQYALDMLKVAGVDMTTPRPIEDAMKLFEQLLGELEQALAK